MLIIVFPLFDISPLTRTNGRMDFAAIRVVVASESQPNVIRNTASASPRCRQVWARDQSIETPESPAGELAVIDWPLRLSPAVLPPVMAGFTYFPPNRPRWPCSRSIVGQELGCGARYGTDPAIIRTMDRR